MSKAKYSIIPKPQRYDVLEGEYKVTQETAVLCIPEFIKAGNYLSEFLKTKKNAEEGSIKINRDDTVSPEGYILHIDNNGIVITASDENGAFYGAVTLKLIIMQSKTSNGVAKVSGLHIVDYPKYSFRGGMLDSSRHYFTVDAVKRLLDSFALLKLNKFHWHLSDDQGYRIESEEFPLLNEIGSKRQYEFLGGIKNLNLPELKKGGDVYFHYYKKDEIRDIVAYAEKLCIDVIPEIDVPGHTTAFIASYKNLSCMKGDYEVFCSNGITKDILCAGQEETYDFLEKLLKEVCELFPYEYFHIGGDEASDGHKIWESDCPRCKELIQKNGYKNGAELQVYFTNRVNEILKKLGKKCIQWNDGFGENTAQDITCQYWIKASALWLQKESSKRKFIVSPDSHTYFDMTYSRTPLKKTYNYNVAKSGIVDEKNVMGIEFETWTEWITDESSMQFAVYPRIFAVSEIAWTNDEKRDYKDFYKRLDFFKSYMKSKNTNYSRIEKKKLRVANHSIYTLGRVGAEYKYNEKLKAKE